MLGDFVVKLECCKVVMLFLAHENFVSICNVKFMVGFYRKPVILNFVEYQR